MKRRDFLVLSSATALAACVPDRRVQEASGQTAEGSATSARTDKPLEIEVWHDLVCPWCRIGLHNLAEVLDGWSGRPVQVRLHPFLLNPNTPPEGVDLREELEGKYGQGVSGQMFARVTQAGAQYGVRFDWEKVRVSPATAPAHALLGAVAPAEQGRLLEALHVAYFEHGRNFGVPKELVSIAASAGVAADRAREAATDTNRLADVRARAARAPALGVRGVPHFRVGSQTLRGAQPPTALRAAMEAAAT